MTQYRHLKVSNGRVASVADADNFYTSAGREIDLLEIVYAGMSTQSFTVDGATEYTLGGVTHVFAVDVTADAGKAAAIVAGGLKLTHTANTAETAAYIGGLPASTKLFLKTLLGKKRMTSGRWAVWMRLASGWSLGSSGAVFELDMNVGWTRGYARVWRGRNFNGSTNDANGGLGNLSGINNTTAQRYAGDFDTHDCMGIYCNAGNEFQFFSGAWNSGWPAWPDLVCLGGFIHTAFQTSMTAAAIHAPMSEYLTSLRVGGAAATVEMTVDRIKFTAYD